MLAVLAVQPPYNSAQLTRFTVSAIPRYYRVNPRRRDSIVPAWPYLRSVKSTVIHARKGPRVLVPFLRGSPLYNRQPRSMYGHLGYWMLVVKLRQNSSFLAHLRLKVAIFH